MRSAEANARPQAAGVAEARVAAGVRPPAEREPEIPERPALAPDVELKGEMTESAFKEPPWLIERGGRYIQVSKLLYHVAEQANGERGLEEIAAGVSAATGRRVTADNVRQLAANLIRSGVLRKADGSVVGTGKGEGARSPLAVNMRMAMLSPRFIEPVTAVLQVLYRPPIVLAVLALAGLAQAWLYLVHGVGGSIHQAVYTPALMLAVLAVIVVAAAFHEFGHAAALRYGGGRVKGMGAGLYIVYPAFYTDVTDNYRLPRWSRVRTDLGGFYFNIIFALAVMGLWVLTRWEFLLLIVVLINLEIIHQLLPFVRLDGYWTLADVTGIPDFFSQVKPFFRSLLPSWVPISDGPKLPELKTWAKLFFVAYLLVTIPLLLFLLFLAIRAVPRILATLLDSLGKHGAAFTQSFGSGDTVATVAAAAQVVIVLLPTFGLAFLFYSLGRRVATKVWRWSAGSTAKRAVAAMGAVAAVALLAFLWAPQLILPGAPPFGAPGHPLTGLIQFEPIRPGERFTVGEVVAATAPREDGGQPPGSQPAGEGGPGPAGPGGVPAPTLPGPDANPSLPAPNLPVPDASLPLPVSPSPSPALPSP